MPYDFPSVLSSLRKLKGVSQREAAGALGISQALLSHYENGVREPGLDFLCKACSYYGVSADYLLGRQLLSSKVDQSFQSGELPVVANTHLNALCSTLFCLFQMLVDINSAELLEDCMAIIASQINKTLRYIREFGTFVDVDVQYTFEQFCMICDADSKIAEVNLLGRLYSLSEDSDIAEKLRASSESIKENYHLIYAFMVDSLARSVKRIEDTKRYTKKAD